MRIILAVVVLSVPALAAEPPRSHGSIARLIRSGIERTVNQAASDQDLRKELLTRRESEQKLRFEMIEASKEGAPDPDLIKRLTETDRANREWLQAVIDKVGWPGIARVGFDGDDATWLLVQHADADLSFQKKALELLREAVKKKSARPIHLAYLTDRVLCAEGKKQVYGTQFIFRDGKAEPRPIEDEVNLDKRRADVGLSSFAEYRKLLEKVYGK